MVTPCHNESRHIGELAKNLASLKLDFPVKWIVVDDNSTDDTLAKLQSSNNGLPAEVLSAKTSGLLIEGGAFKAWDVGVKHALKFIPDFTHIMKLDADVELDYSYFDKIKEEMLDPSVGIVGGVITGRDREQNLHVPGPVKLYSQEMILKLSDLPLMPGFDVMDEVVASLNCLKVVVIKSAYISLTRTIGSSQGRLHGRRRNGMICRWTGYHPIYFYLHVFRYLFRSPYLFGSFAMIYGFVFAEPSPYSVELRSEHSRLQKSKMTRLISNPYRFIKEVYFA
jgi:glycosyltransferase involved in cell wall biosynthesis